MFHVVGIYENSASVASNMMSVETAPPRATADQVMGADGLALFMGAYTFGELKAV